MHRRIMLMAIGAFVALCFGSALAQDAEYALQDYMPGTVGATWTLQATGGGGTLTLEVLPPRDIGGKQVSPTMATASDGGVRMGTFETVDADSYIIYGLLIGGPQGGEPRAFPFDPPAKFAAKMTLGQEQEAAFKVTMGNQTMDVTMTLKLDAVETVTVPRGTFDNCLKLVNTVKFTGGELVDVAWHAKGVGPVKMDTTSPNGQVDKRELVDYKLAAPRYDESGAEKLGWKLAIQAWTNNQATLYETLELAQRLGLHYLEAFPGQRLSKDAEGGMGPEMSEEQVKGLLDKAEACGVKIVNYGVTGVPGDEAGARKFFDWAKKMGLETIVCEPSEDQVALLDKLAGEFDMKIAIHNHPQPSHYWNPETVLAAVPGASPRVGSCADTGHWVRSGLDPVECIKKLTGRIESLHFKDLNARTGEQYDVIWGTGASDAGGQLAALKAEGFRGVFSIEYEHQWSEADLVGCAEFFFAEANKLAAE